MHIKHIVFIFAGTKHHARGKNDENLPQGAPPRKRRDRTSKNHGYRRSRGPRRTVPRMPGHRGRSRGWLRQDSVRLQRHRMSALHGLPDSRDRTGMVWSLKGAPPYGEGKRPVQTGGVAEIRDESARHYSPLQMLFLSKDRSKIGAEINNFSP